MPTATMIAVAMEIVLVGLGLVLLTRFYLRPQSRAAAPALPAWDIAPMDVLIFLWFACCGGIAGQLVSTSLPYVKALANSQRILVANGAFHFGMISGVGLFALLFRGRFTPNGSAPANIFLSGLVTFLISLPVVFLAGFIGHAVMKAVGLPLEKQSAIDMYRATESQLWRFILCFLAVVIAPLSEELVFRAGLFRYLRTRVPRWAAFALPACIFAFLHGNLASFAQLAALGVVFSLAYERTGKIGTCIVAHALFNFHTVLFLVAGVEI